MPFYGKQWRTQRAVLWPKVSIDRYGQPRITAGDDGREEIKVRWETGRMMGRDAQGNPVSLDATAVVDREVTVGSIIALGRTHDWDDLGTANAADLELGELMEVVGYEECPDIKGRSVMRVVSLKRYKDTQAQTV